jgi:putative (di)nucleoside polyphosphate hydrolase
MSNEIYFRVGVGLLIVNAQGNVLAAERADHPAGWQAPQGGLQPSEEPLEAARRELVEETGIEWDEVTVLAEHAEWLGYELPEEARSEKTGRGQVHKWFLLRFLGDEADVDLASATTPEFGRWRWVAMTDLVEHAWHVRRPVYRRLAESWSAILGTTAG